MALHPKLNTALFQNKLRFEWEAWGRGKQRVAGLDEVGRGPLAGPVVAACVLLSKDLFSRPLPEYFKFIDDSKKISPAKRSELSGLLCAQQGLEFAIGIVESPLIDQINILEATRLAMQKAVAGLTISPDHLLIDGNQKLPAVRIEQTTIVKGDSLSWAIGAASIVAKVTRDALMKNYEIEYPQYGFAKHKGYGTQAHLESLRKHGPCPIHRKSFAPMAVAV